MKRIRPISSRSGKQWVQDRSWQQAELNRRIYSPENRHQFLYAWYILDEMLKLENVLSSFNQLVRMWKLPGCQEIAQDYIEYLDTHPECDFHSLARKYLKNDQDYMAGDVLQAKHENNSDFDMWINTLIEFVLKSFNTEENYAEQKYEVSPDRQETAILITAIMLRSLMIFYGLDIHNLEKYQFINVDVAMISDRDSRMKRKLTRIFNHFHMVHSGTVMERAHLWVGCRVLCKGPLEYCRLQYKETNIFLDYRNAEKDIKLCDIVVGYPRRK